MLIHFCRAYENIDLFSYSTAPVLSLLITRLIVKLDFICVSDIFVVPFFLDISNQAKNDNRAFDFSFVDIFI